MTETFANGTMLMAFLAASFVLAATPGPGVLFIVTRTISHGRGAGLASVGGVALGNFGNAVGASIGLAALFAISSTGFFVVKMAGAGYLIYLGLTALRAYSSDRGQRFHSDGGHRSALMADSFSHALMPLSSMS